MLLAAGVLSVAVALVARGLGVSPRVTVGVLTGFGVVALASLLTGLLDSCNRIGWALIAVAPGDLAALAVRLSGIGAPGATLLAGGIVVLLVAGPPAVELVRYPGRRLATSLLIP